MFRPRLKKLIFIIGITFLIVFLLAVLLQKQYAVPILMYHSVSPTARPGNRVEITDKTFKRQMAFLKNNKYNIVSLETIGDIIKAKNKIPPKTAAITFDDGYKDNYLYAFPVLKKYNFPATIFVIINEVGRVNKDTGESDRLSWEDIRVMADSGLITIGSHACGPEPLINIKSEAELRKEIFNSREILEKKLKKSINTFSYPGGFLNPKIRQLVIGAGYHVAVATNPGKKFSNQDIYALKRLRISESARNLLVFWIEASGYYNFIRENRHK